MKRRIARATCGTSTNSASICGSGRVLADLISGADPEIAAGDLSLSRYAADALQASAA